MGYCEQRGSSSASAAEERQAGRDVRRLIALARAEPAGRLDSDATPTVRDALADALVVLEGDCADSPLQRPVKRELAKSR